MANEAGFRLLLLSGLYCVLSVGADADRRELPTADSADLVEILEVIHGWRRNLEVHPDGSLSRGELNLFIRFDSLPLQFGKLYAGRGEMEEYLRSGEFRSLVDAASELLTLMLKTGVPGIEGDASALTASMVAAWQSGS